MLSFGIGIRKNHTDDVLAGRYDLPTCEVIAENYLHRGGRMRRILERLAGSAGVCIHGVSVSLGSAEPLDLEHLRGLRRLAQDVDARVVSDHLCFTRAGGVSSYDLWPMHFTDAAVRHLAERIRIVQDVLGRRFCVENVSSYVRWVDDELTESAFLNAVCAEADCGLLLDLNNLYVNSQNHGFDFHAALQEIDLSRVQQVHLAGHKEVCVTVPAPSGRDERFLLDDHSSAPSESVVAALVDIAARLGDIPVILEWDESPPRLPEMCGYLGALVATIRDAQAPQLAVAA
jgi:hypothetical protein